MQSKFIIWCSAGSLFDAAQAHYFMHINREGGKGLHFDYFELIINLLLLCLLWISGVVPYWLFCQTIILCFSINYKSKSVIIIRLLSPEQAGEPCEVLKWYALKLQRPSASDRSGWISAIPWFISSNEARINSVWFLAGAPTHTHIPSPPTDLLHRNLGISQEKNQI